MTAAAALLLLAALAAAGRDPLSVASSAFGQALGTPAGIRDIFAESAPLMLCGLAVFIALKAGLFNIGAEGQLTVGAFAAAAAALAIPNAAGALLGILAGAAAGALWAFPAAWLKVRRGAHEVISTILLNYLAGLLAAWLVSGPWQQPDQQSPTTSRIEAAARLPWIIQEGPFRLGWGIVFAAVLTAAFAWWHSRSTAAYELRLAGSSPRAAEAAGAAPARVQMAALMASGAVAGLAGAFLVLAQEHRFYDGFSASYGFDGLGVALIAGGAAWALIPAGFVFGLIAECAASLGLQGVPRSIGLILLGLLLMASGAWRRRGA